MRTSVCSTVWHAALILTIWWTEVLSPMCMLVLWDVSFCETTLYYDLSNPTLNILVRFSCWFPNFFSLLLFVEFCVCICIYIIHIVSNILHVISSMVLLYLIMKNTLSEIFINYYVYLITHIHTVLSPIIQSFVVSVVPVRHYFVYIMKYFIHQVFYFCLLVSFSKQQDENILCTEEYCAVSSP